MALLREPIFEPPTHNYHREALICVIEQGRVDMVEYILCCRNELIADWHADISTQERRYTCSPVTSCFALI